MKVISAISKIFGENHRDLGDRQRDSGLKAEAAETYAKHLIDHPDDFDIWVQRGNCLKDIGSLDAAELCYRRAIDLRPTDSDVYLQLGHLFKMHGDLVEAFEAYKKSAELAPNASAVSELKALGVGGDQLIPASYPEGRGFFYEIDDFFSYLKHHSTMSGIQRVQAGLILTLAAVSNSEYSQNFIIWGVNQESFVPRAVSKDDLVRFIKQLSSFPMPHSAIKNALERMESQSVEVSIGSGDTLCILGAFWNYDSHVPKYGKLKSNGALLGVYIYDVIPVTHPVFCEERLTQNFVLSLGDVFRVFDFIFAISEFTASEVRKILKSTGLPELPVQVVPLAHVLTTSSIDSRGLISKQVAAFEGRDFVLFVSTIEGRKNHALVVAAWRAMVNEGLDPPDVVFVGRNGWRVESLYETLNATDYLDGRIQILNELSDRELHSLYKWCRFTVFPSFVEGWGLPVGESLVAGRPCVASFTSSIPEVGGDFVDYIDPYNIESALGVLKKMCFDNDYIKQRTDNIKMNFVARNWAHVGEDFLGRINSISREPSVVTSSIRYPILEEGVEFSPSKLAGKIRPEIYMKQPYRLLLRENWYAPEDFGVWMKGQSGSLLACTALAPDEEVMVLLELVVPPWGVGGQVRCMVGEGRDQREWFDLGSGRTIRVMGRVDAASRLHVEIRLRSEPDVAGDNDTRRFAVGLKKLTYVGKNNLTKRIEVMERHVYV